MAVATSKTAEASAMVSFVWFLSLAFSMEGMKNVINYEK
jgi:arginine exporter protein ArgO